MQQILQTREAFGSPDQAAQVWKYCPALLCNHLILRYVLIEDM